jgi:RND family efflux transporter MFP subunit
MAITGQCIEAAAKLARRAVTRRRVCAAAAALALLAGCDDKNTYVPPPPPKVVVAHPVEKEVARYLEATGNAAPVKSVDLVARVQGFLQTINYQDGAFVTRGTLLFVIEPEPYKLKLEQAQAAELGAKASLVQAEAEFKRQAQLGSRQFASQSVVDQARATRDTAQANVQQAEASTQLAAIDDGYTQVTAPFDGIVTAHLASVGELVGGATPTPLATIVQLDPIYVNFTISEQAVERIRAELAREGKTAADLKQVPVEVGLQTESGYPHKGTLDYAAPTVDQATGTLAVRGIFANKDRALLPGNFLRVRVPINKPAPALLVPDVALGSDQSGRYVLVVNAKDEVEQRKVEPGELVGDLRVIDKGLKPDDRVVIGGVMRAVPGQKVAPEMKTAAAATGAKTGAP